MGIRNHLWFIAAALLAAFLSAGCQGNKDEDEAPVKINPEKDIHELYRRVVKEREKTAARAGRESMEDEALRKRHMDAADACLEKYAACLGKCGNASCEDRCLSALSICEKDLPQNLKTVKER